MVSAKAVFYCILYSISYAAAAMFTRFLSVETPKYYIPGLRAVLQVLLLLPVIYHGKFKTKRKGVGRNHKNWKCIQAQKKHIGICFFFVNMFFFVVGKLKFFLPKIRINSTIRKIAESWYQGFLQLPFT